MTLGFATKIRSIASTKLDGPGQLPANYAWEKIDSGKALEGLELMAQDEQLLVLRKGYSIINEKFPWIALAMASFASSAIPGSKFFLDYMGSNAQFSSTSVSPEHNARMIWITYLAKEWADLTNEERNRIIDSMLDSLNKGPLAPDITPVIPFIERNIKNGITITVPIPPR